MSAQRLCKKNMKRMYQEKVGQSMPTRPRKAKSDRLEGFAAHGNQANQHKRRGLAVAQFYKRRTVFPSASLCRIAQRIPAHSLPDCAESGWAATLYETFIC